MRERQTVLVVTSVVLFCSVLVWFNYSAVLPFVVQEWDLSGTEAGIVFGAFQAGYLVAIVPAGILADRYSPRWVISIGAAGTALPSLVFAIVADSLLIGTLLRFTSGLFVAADERGPGYDILDITGRVAGTAGDEASQPTPIEVKAVTGEAPYTVRFTVNEFRRALAFVRNDIPYRIQLIRIEDDDIDSLDATSITPAPGVTFRTPADLYAYLPDLDLPTVEEVPDDTVDCIVATTLERTIRGGYLRITFD